MFYIFGSWIVKGVFASDQSEIVSDNLRLNNVPLKLEVIGTVTITNLTHEKILAPYIYYVS